MLVTGAGSGRRAAKLEKTTNLASASGGKMLVMPTNVTMPDEVRALFAKTEEAFGQLDVLFNNTGLVLCGTIAALTLLKRQLQPLK